MKRFTFLCAAMLFAVVALAQLSIWNGSSDIWTKGAGTEASPYLIESAEQLAFISDMVNGGVTTYEDTYFKLMTNIDLNNLTWIPIGSSVTNCFKGYFEGNDKTIFNNTAALFGFATNATINRFNVELEGLIEKKALACIIENCQYWGHRAMVCQAEQTIIRNCKSHVEIDNTNVVHSAGLVDSTYQCLLEDCYVDGRINTINSSVGTKNTEDNRYFSALRNQVAAGGLVAISNSSNYIRCTSNCIVEVSNTDNYGRLIYSAGIIGISCLDTIAYCSNVASASGNFNVSYHYSSGSGGDYYSERTGISHTGIIGINAVHDESSRSLKTLIKNNYTINDSTYVKNYVVYAKARKGGYTGYDYYLYTHLTPTIINSYTNLNKTEASMKSASFPIILNTDSTVFIQDKFGVNDGYPIYKEQVYAITNPATDIQLTSANLSASYYALSADSIGFEYKESADKTHWYKRVTIDTLSSDSSYKLDNLATGTDYTYRFWVAQNGVFYFGEELTFTTQECSTNTYPETATICNGEEYEFANKILTTSGVYYDTLTAVNGCDSIIELTLTVSPVNEIQKYDTIDAGESYDFFGHILTETGTYKHYLAAGAYCNLVIMNLYVKQPSVVVSVQSSNPSLGIVIGGGTYEKYTPITLTAIPNQGCRFVKWTDGNTDNPRIIIPESDCTYIADFEEVNYTLTLAANDVAMGNVFGAGTYKYGTEVAINAIPNTGYQFTQWSDNDTNASRTITITSDLSLTAYFQPIKYTIIATANDETLGTVYGSGEYAYNTSVSLMAVPQNGCEFITWSNGVNSNPYTFVAVDNVTLQAIFRATSSGVEDVDVDANTPIQKIFHNGQLLIIRDGKTYNVMGQEL